MIHPAELIGRKRDGEELSDEELSELVLGYARGEIPDYQLAAFLMAVYFRGLSSAETFALTDAMIRSGETIDLPAALGRKVSLRTREPLDGRSKFKGELEDVRDDALTLAVDGTHVEIPYETIVRGNLIDER